MSGQGKVFIVGVAGGSASGKTTFARELFGLCKDSEAAIISIDSYYKAQPDLSLEQRAVTNYDQPESFEFELLEKHLKALRAGESVEVPVYDFTLHTRSGETHSVSPKKLIIVEGIFALYPEKLRALYDLKVFIELAEDLRFRRRLARDIKERGRSEESVRTQWKESVEPGYKVYEEPTKLFAELVGSGFEFDHHTAKEVLRRAGLV